jgi:aryl-alcohol dehydrogenase-like predicted oxidoreductase
MSAYYTGAGVDDAESIRTIDRALELGITLVRELGIGFVAYSPLGRGFLTGRFRSMDQLDANDFRRNNPRLVEGNLEQNMRIVDEVEAVAREAGATPAQVALAWLLAQGADIAAIPGTRRVSRVEENAAADGVVRALGRDTAAVGDRYADMATVSR